MHYQEEVTGLPEKLKVMTIFGTRPEAIKMAPVVKELEENVLTESVVVVTAQHREMLDQVLDHFSVIPDYDLDIMQERQSLAGVTYRVLLGLEDILEKERPDVVLVHGDTTTTLAASLAAFYYKIPVGHVEAGLRTYDRYSPYPEELNRQLTDVVSEYYFAPTEEARENLEREGKLGQLLLVTGNTVIDALLTTVKEDFKFHDSFLDNLGSKRVILVEAHRRENWGQPMENIALAIREISERATDIQIIVSVHRNPEVSEVFKRYLEGVKGIYLMEPLDYPKWANLMARADLILTDSGGIQEEAPSLGTPVLLLREKTERPEALAAGTVRQVGTAKERIIKETLLLLKDNEEYLKMANATNPYGDGRASKRIVESLLFHFGLKKQGPEPFSLGI